MSAAPEFTPVERIERAHAAARGRLRGGPAWEARRSAALARLVAGGLPDRRDENWKYLDWPELTRRRFEVGAPAGLALERIATLLLDLPEAWRFVLVDGRFQPALSRLPDDGSIRIESLASAAESDPGKVASLPSVPGDGVDERFALLAEAFADDGALLRLADGADARRGVYLVHVSTGESSPAAHARVVVEAGRDSHLRIVEHFVSAGAGECFTNLTCELRLGVGSRVDHLRLHQQDPAVVHVETLLATQDRNSAYTQAIFAIGGRIVRSNLEVRLQGPAAETRVHGLFMVDGVRQADLYALIEHAAPHTRSEQVFRGVAADRGRGAYNGRVRVREDAAKADSQQSSRNLILSPLAEINTRPQLEILTDDVKCSHGATTGSLDADQLFYLLSRGIDPDTARGLLTFAFCEDVVAQVTEPGLRRHIEELVVGHLPDRDIIREFV
jgi:Fe-S cluster assembly protein SufD